MKSLIFEKNQTFYVRRSMIFLKNQTFTRMRKAICMKFRQCFRKKVLFFSKTGLLFPVKQPFGIQIRQIQSGKA